MPVLRIKLWRLSIGESGHFIQEHRHHYSPGGKVNIIHPRGITSSRRWDISIVDELNQGFLIPNTRHVTEGHCRASKKVELEKLLSRILNEPPPCIDRLPPTEVVNWSGHQPAVRCTEYQAGNFEPAEWWPTAERRRHIERETGGW